MTVRLLRWDAPRTPFHNGLHRTAQAYTLRRLLQLRLSCGPLALSARASSHGGERSATALLQRLEELLLRRVSKRALTLANLQAFMGDWLQSRT